MTGISSSVEAVGELRSVLIVLMGSLGDISRGFVLLPALKKAKPELHISWLVEPRWEQIVRLHPMIDEVLVFNRPAGLSALPALYKNLQSRSFDVTLDLQRHFKSGLFSFFSSAPRRIGFNRANSKEQNWRFQTQQVAATPLETAKLEQYLSFLDILGIPRPPQETSGLEQLMLGGLLSEVFVDRTGQRVPPPDNYLTFIMGSSWESKDWPLEGYFHLAQRLLSGTKLDLVLVGDKSQGPNAVKLGESLNSNRVHPLAGHTNLPQLAALLRHATVCIGPDSGPGHLAAAFGTPTVTLFGPTSPQRTKPLGPRARAIGSSIGCAPCYRRKCPGLDSLCMRLLSVDDVYKSVEPFLPGGLKADKPPHSTGV